MQSIHEYASRKIYKHVDLIKVYDMIKNSIKTTDVVLVDVKNSYGYVLVPNLSNHKLC